MKNCYNPEPKKYPLIKYNYPEKTQQPKTTQEKLQH